MGLGLSDSTNNINMSSTQHQPNQPILNFENPATNYLHLRLFETALTVSNFCDDEKIEEKNCQTLSSKGISKTVFKASNKIEEGYTNLGIKDHAKLLKQSCQKISFQFLSGL